MNTHSSIQSIDPTELTVHPLAKKLPTWSKDDERFIALVEDIRECGIQTPIRVDAENRILDGREVWKAAKQLQLKSVPIVRDERDVATVIVSGLVHRKHYTKGALAYVVCPLLQPAYDAVKRRQIENLKKGQSERPLSGRSGNIEDFCESIGIGRTIFFQAKELHKLFDESDKRVAKWVAEGNSKVEKCPDDLRALFEGKLLNGEIGLGAAIAGIAGLDATKGKPREEYGQLSLFDDWIEKSEVRFSKWEKLREDEKRAVAHRIEQMVKAMPEDLRASFAKAIKKADKAES